MILKAADNKFIALLILTYSALLLFSINNLSAQSIKTSNNPNIIKYNIDTAYNNSEDKVVYTPAGPTRKSKVHLVDNEHHLNIINDHIQIIHTKTGRVEQEFGDTLTYSHKEKDRNRFLNLKKLAPGNDSSGWITYADWYSGNNPITYFSTNWIVPSPPATNSGQFIYLFNGLQSSSGDGILQPVLQWGFSPAGGGDYWAIANWFVWGGVSNYEFFHSSLIEVNPGANLTGVMKLTSDSGNIYSYSSSFTRDSIAGSTLQLNNAPPFNWADETLEVYGISKCSDYPSDEKIKMSDIQIKVDSTYPTITWTPANVATECGQHTNIVSNSSAHGEVDLYFHNSQITYFPPPVLISPPIAGIQSITPSFTWQPVDGASSYRILVATNPSALPSDPTADGFVGSGGIIDTTTTGTSYIPTTNLNYSTTYYWEVDARGSGYGLWSSVYYFFTTTSLTGVEHINIKVPTMFSLAQNYPNPFNPTTTISFNIPTKSFVTLKVFDLLGREVAAIVSEEMPAGSYTKQYNATNMSSGIYFCRLQVGTYTEMKKLIFLK